MLSVVLVMIAALAFTGCMETEEAVQPSTSPEATETAEAEQSEPEVSESPKPEFEPNIVTVTEETFNDVVRRSEGLILVEFWADWCEPCQELAPVLEEVSAETGIMIAKINADKNEILVKEFGIHAIPATYAFVDGEHVDTILGQYPKNAYLEMIEQYK